jgi:uncharacterized protein YrzB (UPF0473 family)
MAKKETTKNEEELKKEKTKKETAPKIGEVKKEEKPKKDANKKAEVKEEAKDKHVHDCDCGCSCSDDCCDCGGGEDEFYEEDIITLTDEEGKEVDFYVVADLDYKGKLYSIVQPVEELEELESDEVLIFEVDHDPKNDEDAIFTLVEDEKLLQEIFDEYIKVSEEEEEEEKA